MVAPVDPLRVALLTYRGDPFCGGQGVYVRNLSRELVRLGHDVEVLGGPPYPDLDDGVRLTRLPSLDLYREPDPFRIPAPGEFRDLIDVLEFGVMSTGGFPEPRTFSLRVRRELRRRRDDFDVVHDNQTLGSALAALPLPLVTTIHHPLTVDRRVELAGAAGPRRLSVRRWYGFVRMQRRAARRLEHVITVSRSSEDDIVRDLGVPRPRITRIPVGFDPAVFHPRDDVARVPGRLVTTASADVPLKGLGVLLEAVAKLRTAREVELVVVGRRRHGGETDRSLERFGLEGCVRFVSGIDQEELASLLCSSEVAVVPSLYEGFSLPAIEAMASGTPLLATTGGALPEVVGEDGVHGRLVQPGDAGALAVALEDLLGDPDQRRRLGAAGRARVVERFTWARTAAATADVYRAAIDRRSRRAGSPRC